MKLKDGITKEEWVKAIIGLIAIILSLSSLVVVFFNSGVACYLFLWALSIESVSNRDHIISVIKGK